MFNSPWYRFQSRSRSGGFGSRCAHPRGRHPRYPQRQAAGFTLIEVLVVLVIIAVLMTIMATSWGGFVLRQNLNAAQDQTMHVMRSAQRQAIVRRSTWQVTFRQNGDRVEWAAHSSQVTPAQVKWSVLSASVRIDPRETTLQPTFGGYRVRFDHKGRVSGRLGRLTFAGFRPSKQRRCVFVSTLLGTLREGSNQPTADQGGRYCY